MAKSSNMSIFLSFALIIALLLIINGAESRLTIHGVRHNVVKPSSTLSCESVVGVQTGDTCTSIEKPMVCRGMDSSLLILTSIATHSSLPSGSALKIKLYIMKYKGTTNKQEDVKDDAPPPGWKFTSLARALPKQSSCSSGKENNNKNNDVDDDDGPPPGFTFRALPKLPSSSSDVKQKVKARNVDKKDDEGPPPRWETVLAHQMPPPCMPQVQSSSELELAQLVCGSCRELCTYPRGEKLVQCPSCFEVNHVMEEHEIGRVTCKDCRILLMYQYGAPAVRCFSCHVVTEIGEHNRRAPLSAQQTQRRRRFNRRR